MCGIFGVVEQSRTIVSDADRLRASAKLIAHRGPDHWDVHADKGIGLAHTRLSLVDLSERGNQPMWDPSGRYCLVFNGEIYNHDELRQQLEASGITFRTTSDTEVLLHALTTWGVDASLPKLEGMFAFALHDTHTGSVSVARDRFGIKPLFLYYDGGRTMFASEISAFRPWVTLEPDPLSISSFLQGFGGPTSGNTFYRHVRFLAPGSVADLAIGGRPSYRKLLDADDLWDEHRSADLARTAPEELVDAVENALVRAVEGQLVADAPVGALCSGGVDSSLILAIAARNHPDLAIFHANVLGRYSEHAAASALAEHLGLRLRVVDVTERHVVELIPDVIEHSGHPFVNTPHSVPFFLVSSLVREHAVKAVLSGEGADELFLGYAWQSPSRRAVAKVRRSVTRLIGHDARTPMHQTRLAPEAQQLVIDLHNRFEVPLDVTARRSRFGVTDEDRSQGDSRLLTLDALGYNLRALLQRNDAMGMASSIEARFPYLDTELVGLAVNLPYEVKRRRSRPAGNRRPTVEDKWVLRRVADRYLPQHLSRREKIPFTVDAVQRIRVDPSFFVGGLMASYFELSQPAVEHLLQRAPHILLLRLLHLEIWMHVCLNGDPPDGIRHLLLSHVSVKTSPNG